jgi:carbonic anhydrase/acetyltransferase-like protein (isoleucine patch superfamily)
MLRFLKSCLSIIVVFLPSTFKIFVYRNVMNWSIGQGVSIGFSFIQADDVLLSDGVKIGHFNIIRDLKKLEILNGAKIKNFNQIFFSGNKRETPSWVGTLFVEAFATITSHHFIDLGGRVSIGEHSILAGRDIQIWSHERTLIDDKRVHQHLEVLIGRDVYIGARSTILGCSIPGKSIIGAGSVVTKSFQQEDCRVLIAGNPASIKKRYSQSTVDNISSSENLEGIHER